MKTAAKTSATKTLIRTTGPPVKEVLSPDKGNDPVEEVLCSEAVPTMILSIVCSEVALCSSTATT